MTHPTMLHADRTECHHRGQPHYRPSGWTCPAGIRVTHVRVAGGDIKIGDAILAVQQLTAAFAQAAGPLIAACGSRRSSPRLCAATRS